MRIKIYLFCIIISLYYKVTEAQEPIVSLDFNGNFTNRALNEISIYNNKITFGIDRLGNLNKAGNFDGCIGSDNAQVSSNNLLSINTGGTIAFWVNLDLSKGMDPGTGACSSNAGRHVFFSKGGDGYNTPGGFYAYTSVSNGTQTIGFATSTNSGGVTKEFTLPYNNGWHHYAFVFTNTQILIYVDGVQSYSGTYNINFSEANNQSLYIGSLGPKSTPVNGITYWFPLGGQMDDFYYYTRTLTSTEVLTLVQQPQVSLSPSLKTRIYIDESDGTAAGSVDGERFVVNGKEYLLVQNRGQTSPMINYSWKNVHLYSLDSTNLWRSLVYSCTSNNTASCTDFSTVHFLSSANKVAITTKLTYSPNSILSIINLDNGNKLVEVQFTNLGKIQKVFDNNGFYFVLLENDSNYSQRTYMIKKMDSNGVEIGSLTFANANINSFDINSTQIILTGDYKTYIIDFPNLSYTSFNINGNLCRWVGNNFIISNSSATYRVNEFYGFNLITSDLRSFYLLNNGYYLLYKDGDVKKFNTTHQLVSTFTNISNIKTILPISNRIISADNSTIKQYNSATGSLVGTTSHGYSYPSFSFYELDPNEVYFTYNGFLDSKIFKINSLGKLIWLKNAPQKRIEGLYEKFGRLHYLDFTNIDNAMYFYNERLYLVSLTTESNVCDYTPDIAIKDYYCTTNSSHQAFGGLSNSITLVPSYYDGIGYWEKDGVRVSNSYAQSSDYVNISQSGLYKYTIQQGVCEKSIQKNVVVSSIYNPTPPVLSTAYNPICQGDSTTIIATNCSGTINWNFTGVGTGNAKKVAPVVTTDYSAACYVMNTNYGNCTSPASNPLTINVNILPDEMGLSGTISQNREYRANHINSSQTINLNSSIYYKAKNSIMLMPGFNSNQTSQFTAKIISNCLE